ncbi:Trk-type K+ transport system, membrane component [Geosmithia morbida]|uniref:Potassium transport protein n=1 Tax=Geosmithia morbida TaxID=1094350 RepID=A0A9P5D296_9HYPO|nr:Trk-type K+ transport system, membrane component [Geosmithia morbida]KAF4121261.1 Trk-type K+ transport system, membrane component [Geosmithia morbida]
MLDSIKGKSKAAYASLTSKKAHFNFITAHYCWIISCTIIASIILYGAGQGHISYIDALLFASGINTQAGLNPIDVNKLTTFQQVVLYIFPMLTNPIAMHGMVVALRLYWFEKRFQGITREARSRRATMAMSRSKAREDVETGTSGVNGRHITIVGRQAPRIANDGTVLQNWPGGRRHVQSILGSNYNSTADECAIEDDDDDHVGLDRVPPTAHRDLPTEGTLDGRDAHADDGDGHAPGGHHPSAITFADSAKRSDGVQDNPLHIRPRSHTEHIAILESQRNQDEVLRIPGPRDAERGLGPRTLRRADGEADDGHALGQSRTRDSRFDQGTIDSRHIVRNQTITFEEPTAPKDLTPESSETNGSTDPSEALRFRRGRRTRKDDDEEEDGEDNGHDEDTSGGRERNNRPLRPRRLSRAITFGSIKTAITRDRTDHTKDMPYLSYTPTMARNSNFIGLTLEQRDELGGIEYRSLRTLAFILLAYFWGFQIMAVTFLLPYILHKEKYGHVVDEAGVSRTWWAFWTANVSFNDVGFTLTPDSMISFNSSQYILMIMCYFIIIGNAAFPIMLRFIIWVMSTLAPRGSGLWEELKFLLDHPRRCFTLLFPSGPNWSLFWILILLNVIDVVFFLILDLNSEVVEHLSGGARVVNGLFHAAATRTAGFSSLPFADLHPAMPVLYMIMMYISVFPVAISIRRTNVYEENSLGIYPKKEDEEEEEEDDDSNASNTVSYVSHHLRRQLSFDLWYVFLGFFLLAISEGSKLKAKDFAMFDVLFEVVSAYGTVGMSMGATGVNASLCSQFNTVGKLIIIALMIRGRHRGLPYGLDRAVILPSEAHFARETEQPPPSFARTNTGASTSVAPGIRQRRDSSIQRGTGRRARSRSYSMDRERRLLTGFLHPGPAVHPSAIRPPHTRNKSGGSDALFPVSSVGSHRAHSLQTTVHDGHDTGGEDEARGESADGLAPLPSGERTHHTPHRANTTPV